MVILIISMFVVATLAAILDLQTSFETSLALRYRLSYCLEDNTCKQVHTKVYVYVNYICSMSLEAILAAILDFHTSYAIETYSLDD